MRNKKLFLFPSLLFFPTLGLLYTQTPETIVLGIVSLCMLILFFYTIKTMGHKPESLSELVEMEEPPTESTCIPAANINFEKSSHTQVSEFFHKRFYNYLFLPTAKNFLKNLPYRTKIESSQLYLYLNGEFRDYLIQRRNLFIECDTDGILEEEDLIVDTLKSCKGSLINKNKKLIIPIFSPTSLLGALVLESISGFTEKDLFIYQNSAHLFALEWESRLEYEFAILDPNTSIYSKNHFLTILEEKFLSSESTALFIIELKNADNYEKFYTFMGEFLPFPIYKVSERRIAFFVKEQEVGGIAILMQNAIHELDKIHFFAEFILAYSYRKPSMENSQIWLDDAFKQLQVARKKAQSKEKANV